VLYKISYGGVMVEIEAKVIACHHNMAMWVFHGSPLRELMLQWSFKTT